MWLKFLCCLFGLTDVSRAHYFTALAIPHRRPFLITLNGVYSNVLFDTGSSGSWIFTENVVQGGFKPKSHYNIRRFHKVYKYPFAGDFVATHIVQGRISLSPSVTFGMTLPLVTNFVNSKNTEGIPNGILGAGLAAAFTRAFHTFTIVPRTNEYLIHVGPADPHLPKRTSCISGFLSDHKDPMLSQKWIIGNAQTRLGLSTGEAIPAIFEVDTGFANLAIPEPFWSTMKRAIIRTGARFEHSGKFHHTFTHCSPLNIPSIVYMLNPQDTITVDSSSFAKFYGNKCILTVEVHHLVAQGLTYIGVPLLKEFITEFSAQKRTVSFCQSM